MGRSISSRTARRLDELEHAGRDCRAGNGICRSRATVHIYYNRPQDQPIRACRRHGLQTLAAPFVRDHLGILTVERVERF